MATWYNANNGEFEEYTRRGRAAKLPSWASDAERAEVDRLDCLDVKLMGERGATIDNGFSSWSDADTTQETANQEQMFTLIKSIEARKGAEATPTVKPDLAIAKAFWSILSPNDPRVRLRFVKVGAGAREHWADTMEAIWPKVVELQGQGFECYYVLNIAPHSDGHGWKGCVEDIDITGVRALAADFDDGVPVDGWEWHAEPSIIVHSSKPNGVQRGQSLWLVSDCPVDQFTAVQERIAARYGSDPTIVNPSRILRLPGSLHQKDRANPQLVTFVATAAPQRSLAQLTECLPAAAPRKEKKSTAPGERHPVEHAKLMELLPYVDPTVPASNPKVGNRGEWMGICSAFKNSEFVDAPEGFDACETWVNWCRGDYWKGTKPASAWLPDGTPANFQGGTEKQPIPGEEAAEHAFATSDGTASFGTLVHHAEKGGWTGNKPWKDTAPGEITYGYVPPAAPSETPIVNENWQQEEKQKQREELIDLMDVDRFMEVSDPVELVEGMLFEGENVCFAGPPKSGRASLRLRSPCRSRHPRIPFRSSGSGRCSRPATSSTSAARVTPGLSAGCVPGCRSAGWTGRLFAGASSTTRAFLVCVAMRTSARSWKKPWRSPKRSRRSRARSCSSSSIRWPGRSPATTRMTAVPPPYTSI
jgi:hypothetical protein